MFACVIQCHIGVAHAIAIATGFGRSDFYSCITQNRIAFDYKFSRALIRLRHVLRHLTHTPLRRDMAFACIFLQTAVQKPKER